MSDLMWIIFILVTFSLIIFFVVRSLDKDRAAQRALDKYLSRPLSGGEVGRFYERYIGHLYEMQGHNVVYHGAVNGFSDLGRDLIVECSDEILIIQTKCWAKFKQIPEKHIFQLFGSMTHFKLTSEATGRPIKAVFYTTANYSDVARDVARVLGVEIRTEELNRSYPMIKCNVSSNGEKIYHLPFDAYYDKVKIERHKDEFFAKTVKEAVAKGFRRARSK